MLQYFRFRKRPAGVRRKLLLEGLSPRALLAGVTAEVLDGIATVSGSSASEEIVIAPMTQRDEMHVFADGQCISAWRRSDVREIDVQAFEGDDLIRVADSVAFPVKVTGGDGLDTILIDHPQDHRHGWLFDVEQVMAEGEYTDALPIGQGDHANHAGHDMSHRSSPVELFPIPTDHVHVEPDAAASPLATSVVHEHDPMAQTPVVSAHETTNGLSALHLPVITTEPSVTHEHGTSTDTSAISTAMPVLSAETSVPDTVVDHSEHAGHGTSTITAGVLAVDHSGHASHSASAVSTGVQGFDHSGHAGHGVSIPTAGTDHAAHVRGMMAVGHEHGGDTTSANDLDHAAHIEEMSAIEPGSSTAHESGQHGHVAWANTLLHDATKHDHAGSWGVGSAAFATLTSESRSGHRCEGTDRRLPDSLSLSRFVPDCHTSKEGRKTDRVADASNAAAREQADDGDRLAARDVPAEDRSSPLRSPFALLLAAVGTLLCIWDVRQRRSLLRPNDFDEQPSRLTFEWLGGRGAMHV